MICLYWVWEDTGVLDNTETAPAPVTLGPLPLFYLLPSHFTYHLALFYRLLVCRLSPRP